MFWFWWWRVKWWICEVKKSKKFTLPPVQTKFSTFCCFFIFNIILSKMPLSNDYVCRIYFQEINEKEKIWKCIKCDRERKKNQGWGNLFGHITNDHKDYLQEIEQAQDASGKVRIDKFLKSASDKAKNLHSWMEWIVMNNFETSFVDNRLNCFADFQA